MAPKVHPIFSQSLDNGTVGEFGIGEDGQAYWNGKPIITEEKVILQGWVQVAFIVVAFAAMLQALFAGLGYVDNHRAIKHSEASVVAVTPQTILRALASGEPCDTEGSIFYDDLHNTTLSCKAGKWIDSPNCATDGQIVTDMDGERLTCKAGKWTLPLPAMFK